MSPTPVVALARLRDWGFRLWDPVCLAGAPGRDNVYDSFLLQAFGRLRAGQPPGGVIDYLVQVELELRGVRQVPGADFKARVLVEQLAEYAASLPAGPLRVEAGEPGGAAPD